jgi:hypothetical protein
VESPPKLLMTQELTLYYKMEFPTQFAKCGYAMHLFGTPLALRFPLVENYCQHKIKYNLPGLNYGGNMLDSNHYLIIFVLLHKKIFNQHLSKLHIYTRAILERMSSFSIITTIFQVMINNYSNQIGSCIQLILKHKAIVRFAVVS